MATGFGNAIGEVFHIFASIVPELTGLCLMLSGIGLMFGSLQKVLFGLVLFVLVVLYWWYCYEENQNCSMEGVL